LGIIIIPTDFNSIIFQRGRSTTNQKLYIIAIENGPVEIVDFPMKMVI